MDKEWKNLMYAYIFDKLKIYDEMDLMCHYATDEEYKKWNKENNEKQWYRTFNRVLKEELEKKGYPFKIEKDEENER